MEKCGGPWTLGAIDFKPSLPKNSSSSIADFRYVFDIPTKGQIISKCPYAIIVYPKIATNKFPRFPS